MSIVEPRLREAAPLGLRARLGALAQSELLGDAWRLAINRVVCAASILVGTRLITEWVAPSVYGQYTLMFSAILLFSNLCSVPAGHAVVRFYPELAPDGRTAGVRRALRGWYRQFALFAAMVLVVWGIATWMQGASLLLPALAVVGIPLLVRRDLEANLLNAARRHRLFGHWELVESCARPAAIIGCVMLLGQHVEALLIGQLGAVALLLLAMTWIVREPREETESNAKAKMALEESSYAAELRRFMWPIVPLPLLTWFAEVGDRYAIGVLADYEQVGMYAVIYTLMSQPFLMTGRIARLTFAPVYFQAVARNDQVAQRRTFSYWLAAVIGIGVAGCVLVWLLQDLVAYWLLAEPYRASVNLMLWIAAGNALLALARVWEVPLHAAKQTGRLLLGHLIAAVIIVVVALPLVWKYGAWGAAVACPIYFALHAATMAGLAWQSQPMTLRDSFSPHPLPEANEGRKR